MKKLLAILILAGFAVGTWWYVREYRPDLRAVFEGAAEQAGERAAEVVEDVKEVAKEISAPPPLRGPRENASARLTSNGALQWTNAHRAETGLPALKLNAELSAAAEAKLADMFEGQYFEHVSPSGVGPGDLADHAGYEYVMVGENLALGNYEDDKELVQAWMDSPGHRANILNPKYSEIGIAVGRGMFEGHTTWLAVQEFGRPVSACPQPSTALKSRIEQDKARLDALKARAGALRTELDSSKRPKTQEEADAYNAKVSEYNALATEINALISQIQGEVTDYNGQVQAFNACAEA